MPKKIKLTQDEYDDLISSIEMLQDENELLKDDITIAKLYSHGLEWYDYDDLSPKLKSQYLDNALQLSKNPVFVNEINFLITNLAKRSFTESKTVHDIQMKQTMALSLRELRTRIDELKDLIIETQAEKVADDPHAGI